MPVLHRIAFAAPAALLLAAACARQGDSGQDSTTLSAGGGTLVARATMLSTAGDSIGVATFDRTADGIMIMLHVKGLPVGPHGVHLHTVGLCEPPDFTSAGGHFNPTGATHGAKSEKGPHAGDLPNFDVQQAEAGEHYQATTARVQADDGPNGLFDADGMALVIHAAADDEMTDPTGNAGARIACGVIKRAG